MNIGVACGGTGGHIFPGLATARELQRRGHNVSLWLAGKQVEAAAVQGWTGPVITAQAEGFENGLSLRSLGTVWKLGQAVQACTKAMRDQPPEVLLAMGSYACVGPLGAAVRCRVPYVLHEANVVPGRAIQLFARGAAAVGGCFEETGYHLRRRDLVLTGMPLRAELEQAATEGGPASVANTSFTVLVMGGSGGARTLNEVVPRALAILARTGPKMNILHIAGRMGEATVRATYDGLGLPAEVMGFTHEMVKFYRQADLAIARSGAATCAELGAFGVPALLVPYPFAVRNHQMANARALEKAGAADVVADDALSAEWLAEYLAERMQNQTRLREMGEAARRHGRPRGTAALADLVESRGRSRHGGDTSHR